MSETKQPPLYRAEGVTESERYLNKLGRQTFLSLWSYPGIYRDQSSGKEICDLFVVFDNHIIIFSDKDCEFPDTDDINVDWKRWYKKAIKKSAEQIWGAERWIKNHPDRIFLDPKCTQPFPLKLPKPDDAIFHRIVVAHGAAERCKKFFGGGSGSLMLDSKLIGDDHYEDTLFPFTVGQVNPAKGFIHVFDDATLDIVMRTLDTITDFVMYLTKKEHFLTGDVFVGATGEEDLLGYYLKDINEAGEHDFVFDGDFDTIIIPEGHWSDYLFSAERKTQVEANRISYTWDSLIEKFNKHLIEDTHYSFSQSKIEEVELAHRFLAAEPRTRRRMLSTSLIEVIEKDNGHSSSRFMMSQSPKEPAYVFLALGNPYNFSYADYRKARLNFLEAYCRIFRLEYEHLTDIVGIATELGIQSKQRSEDLMYFDARNWSKEDESDAKDLQKQLSILVNPKRIVNHELYHEYPVTEAERNVTPKEIGRNNPCYCGSGKKYKKCCYRREHGQHRH